MTGTLADLAIASSAFIAGHFILSSQPMRRAAVGILGEGFFAVVYSTIAAGLLTWMTMAFQAAPTDVYWDVTTGTRHLAMSVMLLSVLLLTAGITSYNPTAIGLDRLVTPNEPAPGILKVTRHPVMWAIALWGAIHMVVNGDSGSLIFFGSLVFLALAGTVALDRKKSVTLGAERWGQLLRATSNFPFLALIQGRCRVTLGEIGWGRLGLGLIVYLAFLYGHGPVIGIPLIGP